MEKITLSKRNDVEAVRQEMHKIILSHGEVTVADLYELVGLNGKATYIDHNRGWRSIEGFGWTEEVGVGYSMTFPDPVPLRYPAVKVTTEEVKAIELDLITPAQIRAIANATGLLTSTVRNLLECGWSYSTHIRQPGKWERIF